MSKRILNKRVLGYRTNYNPIETTQTESSITKPNIKVDLNATENISSVMPKIKKVGGELSNVQQRLSNLKVDDSTPIPAKLPDVRKRNISFLL
jgi:hypothetical protein